MKNLTKLISALLLIILFENCKDTLDSTYAITLDKRHQVVLPLQDGITISRFFIPPDVKGENPSSIIEVYLDSSNYKLCTINYFAATGNFRTVVELTNYSLSSLAFKTGQTKIISESNYNKNDQLIATRVYETDSLYDACLIIVSEELIVRLRIVEFANLSLVNKLISETELVDL